MYALKRLAALAALIPLLSFCGRAPSGLLRQGQLPLYDFPLYVTESSSGTVLKVTRDATRTTLASGLDQPMGIATDRYNNVFVVEAGANRLIRIDAESGNTVVVADNLGAPTQVAVDDFGDPFVVLEDDNSIVRATDGKRFAIFTSPPTGITFGVGGVLIASFDSAGRVDWIANPKPIENSVTAAEYMSTADRTSATSLQTPTGVTIDSMGRVYVVESIASNARVLRFNQDGPNDMTLITNKGRYPNAAVSDPVGNIFYINGGDSSIDLALFDGSGVRPGWLQTLNTPQGLAFTQY